MRHPTLLATLACVATVIVGAACQRTEPTRVSPTPGGLDEPSHVAEPPQVVRTSEAEAPPAPEPRSGAYHGDWEGQKLEDAVTRGLAWLAKTQANDGGWGQDGGTDAAPREGVALEHNGNDVANTAISALAFLRAGQSPTSGDYSRNLNRAIAFILAAVESAPDEGLSITARSGTQIQRKLGRYVDTFLATMVLTQVNKFMPDAEANSRVFSALDKCLDKIEKNQQGDGSWNTDGWAPLISTSLASRSLFMAQKSGMKVDGKVLDRVQNFTADNVSGDAAGSTAAGTKGGVGAFTGRGGGGIAGSAGVELYGIAQAMEQLSRDPSSRAEHKEVLKAAVARLDDAQFVGGYGSMGGEEFISYLNLSDSLSRTGGEAWTKWNGGIQDRVRKLQNKDGTWAGHHCITGRVACTSAAVLTLLAERTVAKAR